MLNNLPPWLALLLGMALGAAVFGAGMWIGS
jgi:hypothetical protein